MSALRPVRGTHDIVGDDRAAPSPGRRDRARGRGALRLCRDRDAGVRVHRGVRAHARRDLGHRHQGDVQLRGPRRRAGHAAARVHRRRRARADLGRARPEPAASGCSTSGPVFRYERPQKGRLRQFHQIDVEVLGAPEPEADVEVIALGRRHPRGARPRRQGDARAQHAGRSARAGAPIATVLVDYLAGLPRATVGGQPAAARAQPAAHPRQQGRGRPRDPGRGAGAEREPERRLARDFFDRGAGRARRARHRLRDQPAPGARPRLLHPHRVRVHHHRSSARRARCSPAAATTGWSRRWAGPTRRASAGRPGVERLAMLLDETPAGAAAGRGRADRRPRSSWRALRLAEELRARRPDGRDGVPRQDRPAPEARRPASARAVPCSLGEDELAKGTVVLRDLDSGEQEELRARTALLRPRLTA